MSNFCEPAIPSNWNQQRWNQTPTATGQGRKEGGKQGKEKPQEQKPDEIPLFLTIQDLQRLLRISKNTAYAIVRSGELRAKTVGRQLRIPRSEFLRYLNS